MSHWRHVKTDMKCPLAILESACKVVMPQFADKIRMDETGSMSAVNTWKESMREGNQDITGVYLKYRVGKCDVAFSKAPDGCWQVSYDPYEMPPELKTYGSDGRTLGLLENRLKQEIGVMRSQEIARAKGQIIHSTTTVGGKRQVVRFVRVPTPKVKQQLYEQ